MFPVEAIENTFLNPGITLKWIGINPERNFKSCTEQNCGFTVFFALSLLKFKKLITQK